MTHSDPQYSSRERYSSYYQNGYHNEQAAQYQEGYVSDFAPPTQRSRVMPHQNVPRRVGTPPPQARPTTGRRRVPKAGAATAQRRKTRPSRSPSMLIAGGGVLLAAVVGISPKPMFNSASDEANAPVVCQEKVQPQSVLSRDELSQLLSVSERAPKADVRAVIDEPYCTLPSVQVREGAVSEREAYPLEFNPQTWFIVLYEEGEYAGFDFSFERE
ncbi:hypothetical protein PN498_10635 [Oscillatoria sp. CS-180]|uniref:hypothetical protein n=1 Tax=Oscillatoria sp. CS-180 TaxID=3021720 RepID=UPI0023301EA6|nr:hypothetical protein [Oscillatoria sp. CS-180]MDB9526445.1 hypothetical protein [Oscillatoria sp. CS-180]